MELFDPCLEARMELMNHLGDFSDTTYFKESTEPGESKFFKTFFIKKIYFYKNLYFFYKNIYINIYIYIYLYTQKKKIP